MLTEFPEATEEIIRKEMEGNLCRCTGYNRIVEAVLAAENMIREEKESLLAESITDREDHL